MEAGAVTHILQMWKLKLGEFYFPKEVTKLNQGSHQGKVNMKNQLNLTYYFKFTVKHLGHKKDILNEHPYPFSLKNKNLC